MQRFHFWHKTQIFYTKKPHFTLTRIYPYAPESQPCNPVYKNQIKTNNFNQTGSSTLLKANQINRLTSCFSFTNPQISENQLRVSEWTKCPINSPSGYHVSSSLICLIQFRRVFSHLIFGFVLVFWLHWNWSWFLCWLKVIDDFLLNWSWFFVFKKVCRRLYVNFV